GLQGLDHHVHCIGGEDFGIHRLLELRVLRYCRCQPIRGSVQGSHSLCNFVRTAACDVHDFVKVLVQVAEVGTDDIPVDLLAYQLQIQQLDKHRLQGLAQHFWSHETVFCVFAIGFLCW